MSTLVHHSALDPSFRGSHLLEGLQHLGGQTYFGLHVVACEFQTDELLPFGLRASIVLQFDVQV